MFMICATQSVYFFFFRRKTADGLRISDWSSDVCSSDLVAVAIVFGASAWLLVMGVLTALLHSLGLSWLASFAICAALSLGVTGFAAWRVSVFFDHAGMHATRRQLARFGIGDENDDDEAGDETAPAPQAGAQ